MSKGKGKAVVPVRTIDEMTASTSTERVQVVTPSQMTDLLRDDNGNSILQFDQRGYLNATACAKAHGKTFQHVISNKEWQQELEMAMEEFGLQEHQLVELGSSGRNSTPTWIHPSLAQWFTCRINPRYRRYFQQQQTTPPPLPLVTTPISVVPPSPSVFQYDEELSISLLDMSKIQTLKRFIGRVAIKKGIRSIPTNKDDLLHLYTLGYIIGDYSSVESFRKTVTERGVFSSALKSGRVTVSKYVKTKSHFTTLLAFKEDFIDTGAVNGRFAQALKSVTLKLGNMVQAGCSKEINGIFDQQEADMEAASEEDRQMANEYKKEARKDNGIVPPVTGLLDATDFSPFELLGGSTTTNVHPSVKMEKNGVYFGLVSATYNDHRVVKIGHTSNSEMRIKQHGKAFEGFMVVAFVPTLNYKQLEKKILDAYAHFKVPKEGREKCHRELFFLIDGIKSLQAMYTYAMDQNRSFLTVQSSPSKKYKLQHELKIKKIEEATKIELYRVEKEKDNELLLALMEGMSVDDKIKLLRSTKQ